MPVSTEEELRDVIGTIPAGLVFAPEPGPPTAHAAAWWEFDAMNLHEQLKADYADELRQAIGVVRAVERDLMKAPGPISWTVGSEPQKKSV